MRPKKTEGCVPFFLQPDISPGLDQLMIASKDYQTQRVFTLIRNISPDDLKPLFAPVSQFFRDLNARKFHENFNPNAPYAHFTLFKVIM